MSGYHVSAAVDVRVCVLLYGESNALAMEARGKGENNVIPKLLRREY